MPQTCYYCKRTIEDENDMVAKNITDALSFQNEQREPFHKACLQERSRKKRRQNILIAAAVAALIFLPIFLLVILPILLSII
ncbi:hypothetical protein MUP77_11080 [Candidatus Bathyarchaeota archaeon]|nr:hypothetical protein [Candidatus Bathyarchaeota archaeon]